MMLDVVPSSSIKKTRKESQSTSSLCTKVLIVAHQGAKIFYARTSSFPIRAFALVCDCSIASNENTGISQSMVHL